MARVWVEGPAGATTAMAVEGIFTVRPEARLRGAAGADNGERRMAAVVQVVTLVTVAVQPQADTAIGGRGDDSLHVTQATKRSFLAARGFANRVVGDQNARRVVQSAEQLAQPLSLLRPD